jgi:hypothetical protein
LGKIRILIAGEATGGGISSRLIDSVEVAEGETIPRPYRDVTTSADNAFDVSELRADGTQLLGRPAMAVAGTLPIGDHTLVDIWIAPYISDSESGRVWFASRFQVDIDGSVEAYRTYFGSSIGGETDDAVSQAVKTTLSALLTRRGSRADVSLSQGSPEYIIITSDSLAEAFRPLALWKGQLGYSTAIVTTSDILLQYAGSDAPERIRNYLKAAHAGGVRWVLLGGDETVIPIRYGYHLDVSETVPYNEQQICDLYYADLTGDWDVDGDGLYGEPFDDSPDKCPELMVGRALVDTPLDVEAFVQKSIDYERCPAPGVAEFANRILISSADQMRDFASIGQDSLIAEVLPPHLDVNRQYLAESPSGMDDSPQSPAAADFVSKFSEGFNITYILAHGAPDGFVTRASGYNKWPKSFVFTREVPPAGHASVCGMTNHDRFGVVLTIGCSNGAFDMDGPPSAYVDPCVAEQLLLDSLSGAAAVIGYSRWGWVSCSYSLMMDFTDFLYNCDNRLAPANNYAKANNHTLTDIVYGLNVYGDPALRVWTSTPRPISTVVPTQVEVGANSFAITASSGGQALDSAIVTVIGSSGMLFIDTTDNNGISDVSFVLESDTSVILTVSKSGYLPSESVLSSSITLDAESQLSDENRSGSVSYLLDQNYPNPFNTTTTVRFDLQRASDVRVDIFNALGRLVTTAIHGHRGAGVHEVTVQAADWPSGVYFYRLRTSDFTETKKMVLLK